MVRNKGRANDMTPFSQPDLTDQVGVNLRALFGLTNRTSDVEYAFFMSTGF